MQTVRDLIEQLAKCDWDAEVRMDTDTRIKCSNDFEAADKIKTISSFRHKNRSVVTINSRSF